MLFLALVSSANEQCQKASAHGESYLFGLRLEGINHLGFRTSACRPGGLGEDGSRPGWADVVPAGEAEEGDVCCGRKAGAASWSFPGAGRCRAHGLSPGLGSRVLAYLRNGERVSGSDLWGVSSADGTDAISGEQTLGFCGLLRSDSLRKGSHVWKAAEGQRVGALELRP